MDVFVLTLCDELEILQAVVSSIVIDMMDTFIRPRQHSRSSPIDQMMFVTIPSPVAHSRVIVGSDNKFVRSIFHTKMVAHFINFVNALPVGTGGRIRTYFLRVRTPMLVLLSYTGVVRDAGLKPATSCV